MSTMLEAPGVPFPLMPSANSSWSIDPASASLSIVAAPHSDLFVDPRSASQVTAEAALDAATLLGSPPAGDFQLRARVTVGFASTYDAGALLLWIDGRHPVPGFTGRGRRRGPCRRARGRRRRPA
jgi:hypothetical protein